MHSQAELGNEKKRVIELSASTVQVAFPKISEAIIASLTSEQHCKKNNVKFVVARKP
jgi:hypothetical protein